MTVQAWIILTAAEAGAATVQNTGEVRVEPRLVDNPLADDLGEGPVVGKFVLPARLFDDPDYAAWRPSLSGLAIAVMDSEALFLPADDA